MNAAATSNQKTVPLLEIKPTLLPSKNRVDTYRTLIAVALKEGLAPLKVETSGMERLSMFLQPVLAAKINLVATQHKISFQDAFAGLTAAGVEFIEASQRAIAGLAEEVAVPFKSNGPDQVRYYQGIQAGLQLNKIVLGEASTGVGKGRAICAAAIEAATNNKKPVVIIAPTLKVLGQLWAEMNVLRTNDGLGKNLNYSFYPGASEFVDEIKLAEFMIDHQEDPAVTDWLNKKGVMLDSSNPLREAMKSMGVQPSFLVEDLRELAVNMDTSDFSLSSDNECETLTMLKNIRMLAITADIIFCTHTMFAMSHRLNWALLPEPSVLIIDEAHLFEQSVANVHSDALSLSSLISRLRKAGAPAKGVKAINEFVAFLQSAANEGGAMINMNQATDVFKIKAIAQLEVLQGLFKSKSYKEVERIDVVKKIVTNTIDVLKGKAQDSAYLSFSPDRRYPSISTGKSNLGLILGGLWKGIHGGAVLASATLYIKNQFGDDKCDYICDILAIPASRLYVTHQVITSWLTSIPELHVPSQILAQKIARPDAKKYKNEESLLKAEQNWLDNLAKEIAVISEKAKGGTLILATSYSQVSQLGEYLIRLGIEEERVVTQDRNRKIAVTEQSFREAHKKGLRPIWVGLGSAWTGLNLAESDGAIEDTLLTDLIIVCCPIGMNRTNTMNARIEARSIQPLIKEALMTLKQGLGRLMRNERQKNRHIWFLDGRIYSEWKGMEEFQQSILKIFSLYKNRKTID